MNKLTNILTKGVLSVSYKDTQYEIIEEIVSFLDLHELDQESVQWHNRQYHMDIFKETDTDPCVRAFLAFSAPDEEVDLILYDYQWQGLDQHIFTAVPTITHMLQRQFCDLDSYTKLIDNPLKYISKAKIEKIQKFRLANARSYHFLSLNLDSLKVAYLLDKVITNTIVY